MSTEFETLLVTADGPIIRVVINRPKALNALSETVWNELDKVLDEVVKPDETRVVVIEGSGDKAFVAGADIAAMKGMDAATSQKFAELGQRITGKMEKMPQVFVAKVQGFALGGGCELAMACDIIVAGKSAKFGQPEVNLGLIPGFGGTQRLVRRVGLPVALDILCSGKVRALSGDEAFSLGLASRVVEDDKLEEEVAMVVKGITKAGRIAVGECKRLARMATEMPLDKGMGTEASAFGQCFTREEAKEGISAFLEKRSPKF